MKNLTGLLKQAQEMQQKMQDLQGQMENVTCQGSSGAGLVTITMNGKKEVQKVSIDPSLVNKDEIEVLEDLLVAAFKDALQKSEAKMSEEMGKVTEGMPLPPGFKLPF